MSDTRHCPQCGAPLASQTAQGLCPACLVKVGMASQSVSIAGGEAHDDLDPGLAATTTHAPDRKAGDVPPPRELKLPEPGERFGDYLIVRILGKGGMGAVYEAEQLTTGRRVALKVLKHSLDSPEARKRFLREGRLAASINHPNSVYVFGTEEIDGTPAITMELVAGGTLQERVRQQGPLPVGEAVDIILQIIAGLEAAQRLGVLHRDIKPANCFIDINGVVKVGDFGLSISTAPRGESEMTHSGSFLGTPAFASPEQLRGDELNLRSDMYSVGVTLYYLLTGRTPFNADNMVKLLATVLERTAESPKKWRPEIPQGLAQVVLRCLEKQPTDRFKTYDELRQALLPFASTTPLPAPLGFRFVAQVVDRLLWMIVLWSVVLPMPASWGMSPFSGSMTKPGMTAFIYWLINFSLLVLFFAIPEGLWGFTPGKWLCRLRVVNQRREPPGFAKALVRTLIVMLISAPLQVSYCWFSARTLMPYQWYFTGVEWICYVLLFSTARNRNGLAGLHDLLTGTRVILLPPYQTRTALTTVEESLPATQTATIGPYHVLDVLEESNGEEWILGYDTRLLRRVWIHKLPAGATPTPGTVRNVARPGRLRWLNGKRSDHENWDAYEALTGQPLMKLLDRAWPWATVRFWLLDLAEELDAAAQDGTLPDSLSLDRVWITSDSRAKLLDFAPPGLEPLETKRQPGSIDPSDELGRRRFLNQMSIAALEGKMVDAAEASTRAAAVPVPIPARNVLDRLGQSGGENLVMQLRPLVRQSAMVSRRRRLAMVLACGMPMVLFGGMIVMMFWFMRIFTQMEPDVIPLSASLDALEQYKAGEDGEYKLGSKQIEALEVYIVHRYDKTITDPEALAGPLAQAMFNEKKRGELARMVAAHPHISDEEFKAAENSDLVQQMSKGIASGFGFFEMGLWVVAAVLPFGSLGFIALLSLASALLFRRGLVMRTLGVEIVTVQGWLASRGRTFWRSVIAWSPVAIVMANLALIAPLMHGELSKGWLAIFPLAYLALVVWSLTMSGRGLHDRLAGTWLVPAQSNSLPDKN
jgi:serine/threonine protein kinase